MKVLLVDKRGCKRKRIEVGCWLVEVDGASCCHTFDISSRGVALQTDDPLPVGALVRLQFFTPRSAKPVTVTAEVVWTRLEPDSAMGLSFLAEDTATSTLIAEFTGLLEEQQRR